MQGLVLVVVLLTASQARAECPTAPDDPVCRPWSAVLLPTAYGAIYAPKDGPTFYGGGVELVWIAWSDNSQAFGPSQGRIRSDIGLLTSSEMGTGNLVMWRTGAQVAFERNASRDFAIPYFAVDVGGLYNEGTGRRWFMDGGIGFYLLHRRGVIVDAEATGLLPFSKADQLAGITARLALSFALW
jgi:hypothetical protein